MFVYIHVNNTPGIFHRALLLVTQLRLGAMSSEPIHLAVTYNEVHKAIGACSEKIREEFNPDMLIAIGLSILRYFSLCVHL
jgi:hypothetical protein